MKKIMVLLSSIEMFSFLASSRIEQQADFGTELASRVARWHMHCWWVTSIRTGIPVNARYVTLKVSVWCKSFSIRQSCFVISSQTAPLSRKTQRTFCIPHHAALAINIWPLKKGHRWKLFQNYWQPCWILLPNTILEGNKGEKKVPWFADILTHEATHGCLYIY